MSLFVTVVWVLLSLLLPPRRQLAKEEPSLAQDTRRLRMRYNGHLEDEAQRGHFALRPSAPAAQQRNPAGGGGAVSDADVSAASTTEPEGDDGGAGYLFALSFGEQLESGMHDLQQLADLAESWRLRVVEPYMHNTRFQFPVMAAEAGDGRGQRRLLRLGEVYDLQDLNANLRKSLNVSHDMIVPLGQVPLPPQAGHYNVIVLQLLSYWLSRKRCVSSRSVGTHLQRLAAHLGCPDCLSPASGMRLAVACVNTRDRQDFRTLLQTDPVTSPLLQEALALAHAPPNTTHTTHSDPHPRKKVLVLIPTWNGIRPYRDKFFYWDPDFAGGRKYTHVHSTAHTQLVSKAAQKLLKSLHLQRPIVGVHIRLERLLRVKPFRRSAVVDCVLTKLPHLMRELQANGSVRGVVLFRDYGRYGSNTCPKVGCKEFAQELELDKQMRAQLGAAVVDYTPSSRRLRKEHGFSANVEQEVLSMTDYLVTVGYGSFQQGIVSRFRQHKDDKKEAWHEKDRIFHICPK